MPDIEQALSDRAKRWIDELDEIERMSPDELRKECAKLAERSGFLGAVALLTLVKVMNEN